MKKKPAPRSAPKASAPARYTMKSLEQVRILAHPLRLRLLETFALNPQTTHQVAKALEVPATRLYHHVNALERVGLIRLRETRPVRGTVEKYYEAVGRRIQVDAGLFSHGKQGQGFAELNEAVGSVIEESRRDLARALEVAAETPEELRPLALRATVHATPAQIGRLKAKLLELLREPRGKGTKGKAAAPGGATARITLVFTSETLGGAPQIAVGVRGGSRAGSKSRKS